MTATVEPGRTRSRRVYWLTDAGRGALREWARRPAPYAEIRDQAHVRLLGESERRATDLPHRESYLLLTQSLGRRLVRAYRDWIDEVERELG